MTIPDHDTVSYRRVGPAEPGLDIFRPPGASNRAAVLVFHGGGWRVGARQHVHERAAALAAAGFTALTVQYRLLDAAPWPAPLEDATAALAWTRDHAADLGIDPGKVIIQGHSAGAHIALLTGTLDTAQRPAAVVAYYPPIGFYPAPPPAGPAGPLDFEADEQGRLPGWVLFPEGTTAAELDAASPIALVDATYPPTILLHGGADTAVPYRGSINLYRRLADLGVPSELHTYARRGHEFDRAPAMIAATVGATASFLDRIVVNPEADAAEIRRFPFPPPSD
jgi:acetyl esterase/lipase